MTTAAPMIYFPLTAELLLRANGALDGLLNPPLIEALLSGKDVAFELALTDTPQVRKMLDILDVDFTTESAPMPDGHVEVGKVWYNKNHKNHAPAQRRKILHLDSKGEIIGQTLAALPGDITVPADVIDPQAYPLTLTIQGTEECPIAFGKGKYGSRILQSHVLHRGSLRCTLQVRLRCSMSKRIWVPLENTLHHPWQKF